MNPIETIGSARDFFFFAVCFLFQFTREKNKKYTVKLSISYLHYHNIYL